MSEKGEHVKSLIDELGQGMKDLFGEDMPTQLLMILEPLKQAVDMYELQKQQSLTETHQDTHDNT